MSLIKKMQVAPLSLNILAPWASCTETRRSPHSRRSPERRHALHPCCAPHAPGDKGRVPLRNPGPIVPACYSSVFAETTGFKQSTEGRTRGAFTVLSAGMKSFSLAHDYQMAKLTPWGRWILGLVFLLHMFNEVNKECEEIYVTQRRFSQRTKI